MQFRFHVVSPLRVFLIHMNVSYCPLKKITVKTLVLYFAAFVLLMLISAFAQPAWTHDGDNEAFNQESNNPEEISVDEQGQKALDIEIGSVRRLVLKDMLQATGEVTAAETQAFDVHPPVPGLVKEVRAKQGDTVQKGQTLALVYSIEVANNLTDLLNERTKINSEIARIQTQLKSDITLQSNQLQLGKAILEREEQLLKEGISARKNYLEAKNTYESASVKLATLRQRLDQEVKLAQKQLEVVTNTAKGQLKIMGISEATVDQAIKSGKVTADLPIVAPVNGCIISRSITLGERVDSTKKVFAIVNLNPIWVMVDIFQEQIPSVKEGQQVVIHTPSKQVLKGVISSVGSIVDASTKTLHVRIVADNQNGVLRPGMFVTARIILGAGNKEALVIPATAVVYAKERPFVYRKNQNHFQPVFIETGLHTNDGIEVTSGLQEGESIIVSGAKQLRAQNMLKPGVAETHEGEEHEDHKKHEEEERSSAGQPATSLMFFFGGLVSAFAVLAIWAFIAKSRKR